MCGDCTPLRPHVQILHTHQRETLKTSWRVPYNQNSWGISQSFRSQLETLVFKFHARVIISSLSQSLSPCLICSSFFKLAWDLSRKQGRLKSAHGMRSTRTSRHEPSAELVTRSVTQLKAEVVPGRREKSQKISKSFITVTPCYSALTRHATTYSAATRFDWRSEFGLRAPQRLRLPRSCRREGDFKKRLKLSIRSNLRKG